MKKKLRELKRHLHYLAGLPIRAREAVGLLDAFIICAVGTILTIRIFLWLTGYPKLASGRFHISHIILGGLLMMVGLILLQSIITRWARRTGAVIGGVGFGLFLDELGKFVTKDNDYFFRPTFAIIYVFFILFYLIIRNLLRMRGLTPRESLVNAIEYVKEAAINELDEADQQKALDLIKRADRKNPLTEPVRLLLEQVEVIPSRPPFIWERMAQRIRERYLRWASTESFTRVIATIFLGSALFVLIDLGYLVSAILHARTLSFVDWIALISGTATALFIGIGDTQLLRKRRLSAYRWFDRALLVAILIGQVFVFFHVQLKGIINLVVLLFLLISLRYMIVQEERNGVKQKKVAVV
jgi:hypothetical protein